GIGMVHQHFMLIPKLTVAENVVLGHEPRGLLFDRAAARRSVGDMSHAYGLKLDPDARVGSLSVGLQQRVEILKILYWGSEILIFDEPTAVLTPRETRELFVVLRGLAKQGRTIIFITHKLKEVMELSDEVTVLRAGKVVGHLTTRDTSLREIASRMIGREVLPEVHRPATNVGDTVLDARNIHVESDRGLRAVLGISFQVHAGEILGLAGVEGNGQTELIEALTGLRRATAGRATVKGRDILFGAGKKGSGGSINPRTPPARVRASGVSYVPEDRRERGLVLAYSVADNLILGQQDRRPFSHAGLLDFRRIKSWARQLVNQFDVRPRSTEVPAGNLSGGNQQKVVLAREFSEDPALLIASQPTRGLDIGAAQFVHERLLQKRDTRAAILLVSAELDEVLALADRIAVIYEGGIVAILDAHEATEDRIGLLMTGGERGTGEQAIDLEAPALSPGH
ncbi:MAG: heme ABC transporter ATP-binding protein, partial [Chloroflexi bacterium]